MSPARYLLIVLWCVAWPVIVAWAAFSANAILLGVALVGSVMTPLGLLAGHRARCKRLLGAADRIRAQSETLHAFRIQEAKAWQIESLSDALRLMHPAACLDPALLADLLERYGQSLREASPDPPAIPSAAWEHSVSQIPHPRGP